ncbi:hypothetical protein RhiirC2_794402 [Rhizophagus irregularis]|uniref:Uncharacterized protein n=1 Tax=Rhizophagus irregularis TaxID=588596 RepID=A0A2N1MDM3_9GLOM|nr:hypothetical protein RhiirC2_794402 [Rhizophagus irregularis]
MISLENLKFLSTNKDYYQKHFTRLTQLSSLSHDVFENLLADDLIMGKIKIPLESYNENVKQENNRIFHHQNERQILIETIFYQDSIDKLLQKWQDIIKKICKAIPKKTGIQWLANWSSYLEKNWYHDFFDVTNLNGFSTQRLIVYLLLQKVIKLTFSKTTLLNDSQKHLLANDHLMPEKIIVLKPEKALKFFYIVRWIIYKLIKNNNITRSHSEFETICTHFKILNSEQVVYEQDVRSQTTNVIPEHEFLEFMYKMESLILLLFEKYKEFGPNILQYIHNSLLCNLSRM